jgi:hypothetical protein
MKIQIALFGLITIALLSCGTEDVSPSRLLITQIESPGLYRDHYEYENGRLVSFKRFFGELEETKTQFHYLDNRLTKIEVKKDQGSEQIIELTYGENGLRQEEKLTTIYNDGGTYVKTATFSYRAGILRSIKYSFGDPNYLPTETLFEWENGNISKMEHYVFSSQATYLISIETMTYDDKRNYSNQDIAFIYTLGSGLETTISKNNVTSTTEKVGDKFVDRGSYKFTYNKAGYPDSYVYKVDSQESGTIQIMYE